MAAYIVVSDIEESTCFQSACIIVYLIYVKHLRAHPLEKTVYNNSARCQFLLKINLKQFLSDEMGSYCVCCRINRNFNYSKLS